MKRGHSPNLSDEIQSSYKRICDIKREQIGYEQRLAQIDVEFDKLRKDRQECSEQRAKLLTIKLPQAIVPYSQFSTLEIVTKMRSYLPRELRDMVYKCMVLQNDSIIPTWKMAALASRPECPGRPCKCLESLDVPYAMDPTYVGHEMAREVVEVFYKTWSRFLFELDRVEQVKNVLLLDHFHVGFKPADYAREISISWKLSRSVRETTKKGEQHSRRPLKKDFNPLLKIRNKSGFKLRITISQRHIRFLPLERAITIIKPICQQLIREGANVELAFYYDVTDGPVFPLNDALTKPTATWKAALAEQLDEDEDVMDYHKEYKDEHARKLQSETSSEDSELDEDSEDIDDMYGDMYDGYGAFDYDDLDPYGEDLYDSIY